MRRLFVDTAAWVALLDVSDFQHQAAVRFWESLRSTPVAFVTSDYILDEAYTRLRLSLGLQAAVTLHELIRGSRSVTVVKVGEDVLEEAWEIFVRYQDKEWSFTDCTSFALMRRLRLSEVFTFDDDFRQMGYVAQP